MTSNDRGSKGHELNHLAMLPSSKTKHLKHLGLEDEIFFLFGKASCMLVLGDCKLLEGEKKQIIQVNPVGELKLL